MPLLQNQEPRTPELAARTLRQIGPDAKAAVAALAQRLRDCDASVRQAAVLALREMGPEDEGRHSGSCRTASGQRWIHRR